MLSRLSVDGRQKLSVECCEYFSVRTYTVMAQFANSQLFATPRAPYIKYLEKIKSQWFEAEVLEEKLKALTPVVKQYHQPLPPNRTVADTGFVNVAEILDIHDDVNGRKNFVKSPTPSLGAYNGLALPEPRAIENFTHQLRNCEPSVHTRIIVLHSGRSAPGARAADSLFFCHVLGFELDLPPTDVSNLAQLDRFRSDYVYADEQPRQRLPMKPGFVSLGFFEETRKRSVAAYIGRRTIGNSSPHIGELVTQLLCTKLILTVDSRGSPASSGLQSSPLDRSISWQSLGTAGIICEHATNHCAAI
jgi:hypothetical protein